MYGYTYYAYICMICIICLAYSIIMTAEGIYICTVRKPRHNNQKVMHVYFFQ